MGIGEERYLNVGFVCPLIGMNTNNMTNPVCWSYFANFVWIIHVGVVHIECKMAVWIYERTF